MQNHSDAMFLKAIRQGDTAAFKVLYDSTTGGMEWAWTYNQATCIGAAVLLFRMTGDSSYLADAVLAANYTMKSRRRGCR